MGLIYAVSAADFYARTYRSLFTLRSFGYSRQVTRSLLDMGCYSVSLGDTIGAGTAGSTLTLMESLKAAEVPLHKTAMHFHDTYGQALANILVALEEVCGCRLTDVTVFKALVVCH